MDKRVIRGIYLYEFKLGTTAKEADEKINAAFGQGCSTIRTACRWYQKFRNGDESLEEHEGRGRHSGVDEDKLRDVVEEDPHKGTREIAKVLGVLAHAGIKRQLLAVMGKDGGALRTILNIVLLVVVLAILGISIAVLVEVLNNNKNNNVVVPSPSKAGKFLAF
ncbi:unnamed protein product [Heligmosomoides polygyrus]|uniref:HTH_48 domain-containing protein n=1 Tax=Heligmosomoides polygyrus TaxID=6339 RepID=A0A183GN43_HELPZ|nr:unnamed protein product [Heligmosomoides polygyrus]